MFGSHPREPMVDERGLTDTGPGNDCNEVYLLIRPRSLQKSDVFLSAKNITSCNGQSRYRSLLGSQSCPRPARYGARIGRLRLLEAPTSDPTSCVYSACYRCYRFQKFAWVL